MNGTALMAFKSHINGKNADVSVYPDRVEWIQEGGVSKGKAALGVMTGGLSLAATGIKSKQQGSEVIPVKAISSVTTEKDGFRFTKVRVVCSGNTIDFRVGHGEAPGIKGLLTRLMLGSHPAQAQAAAPMAPPPAAPTGPTMMEQLKQLGELRDVGVLDDAEFQAQKAKILAGG